MSDCEAILVDLQTAADDQQTLAETTAADIAPLRQIAGAAPIWVSWGGEDLPSLGQLLGRIHTLGSGLARWIYQSQGGGETVIQLPATVTPTRTRAWINAVPAPPGDVTIGTDSITLTAALNDGDRLEVRTYG